MELVEIYLLFMLTRYLEASINHVSCFPFNLDPLHEIYVLRLNLFSQSGNHNTTLTCTITKLFKINKSKSVGRQQRYSF